MTPDPPEMLSASDHRGAPTPPALPVSGPAGRERYRPGGWGIVGMVLGGLFGIALLVSIFYRTPYYRIDPGDVYDTVERVEAPGDLVFLPKGEIGFVTVSQTANISVWQLLDAKLDDNVRIRHEDEVRGTQTEDEQREADRRRMQDSKKDAVVVALQKLGYELTSTPLGIEVTQVFDCTAADGTLGTGDLIIGVNGVDVRTGEELVEQLLNAGIGQEVELLMDRIDPNNPAGSLGTEIVGLTLGSADDVCLPDDVRAEEPRPFIGIGTLTIYDEDLPIDVDIDTGSVGGPSAGLPFALAIIDVLSEGELTNGLKIVATGTINRDGLVGPVGGIQQKTVAAERDGADVFIVPMCCENFVDTESQEPLDIPSNYEEALAHADEMQVIGVNTLEEALAAIGELGGNVDGLLAE